MENTELTLNPVFLF